MSNAVILVDAAGTDPEISGFKTAGCRIEVEGGWEVGADVEYAAASAAAAASFAEFPIAIPPLG